jgi:hypothetical protein
MLEEEEKRVLQMS